MGDNGIWMPLSIDMDRCRKKSMKLLARSMSTVPVWENGVKSEGPASPVGAILASLEPAPALPWAAPAEAGR